MIRKMHIWERVLIVPTVAIFMPLFMALAYPLLLIAAVYIAIEGKYTQEEPQP